MDERTCGECQSFDRCEFLMQRKLSDKPCDWTPSRFVLLDCLTEPEHEDRTDG